LELLLGTDAESHRARLKVGQATTILLFVTEGPTGTL
jgi:hypothetical protein